MGLDGPSRRIISEPVVAPAPPEPLPDPPPQRRDPEPEPAGPA